ncbi:DNA-binding protein [Mycolicibacter arupensis]|uniref:DNA-binding protein n=1 Tax=Mycolicibacter arupensis TaxID=342002 RepID=A0A5C7XWI4_9MYCO|nr:DNA-binding protein [Mycolicibacter arupensis]TXI53929.1 MAG: DNA-binding protein [Mycolicibacter arupensis]
MTAPTQRFFDSAEVVAIAHARGIKHITENSVIVAAYQGRRPLKKTKVAGRVYYTQEAIDAWLSGQADG